MDSATRQFRKALISSAVLLCVLAFLICMKGAKDTERRKFAITYAERHGLIPLGEPQDQLRIWGPFDEVYRGQSVFRLSVSEAGVPKALWIRFGRSGTSIYLVDKNGIKTKLM